MGHGATPMRTKISVNDPATTGVIVGAIGPSATTRQMGVLLDRIRGVDRRGHHSASINPSGVGSSPPPVDASCTALRLNEESSSRSTA